MMGTGVKKSIFDEQTSKALKKWQIAVKKKQRGGRGPKSPALHSWWNLNCIQGALLRTYTAPFKTTGHSKHSSAYEDHETSDIESDLMSPTSTANLIVRVDHVEEETEINERQSREEETRSEDDFSFVKPAPPK